MWGWDCWDGRVAVLNMVSRTDLIGKGRFEQRLKRNEVSQAEILGKSVLDTTNSLEQLRLPLD